MDNSKEDRYVYKRAYNNQPDEIEYEDKQPERAPNSEMRLEEVIALLYDEISIHTELLRDLEKKLNNVLLPGEETQPETEVVDEYNTPLNRILLQTHQRIIYLNKQMHSIMKRLRV